MKKKSKHGGARRNAGRKPVTDKKIQLTIYVEQSKIVAAGGLEMAKNKALAVFIKRERAVIHRPNPA